MSLLFAGSPQIETHTGLIPGKMASFILPLSDDPTGCSDSPNGHCKVVNGTPIRAAAEADALAALLAERESLTERVRILVTEKGSLEAQVCPVLRDVPPLYTLPRSP